MNSKILEFKIAFKSNLKEFGSERQSKGQIKSENIKGESKRECVMKWNYKAWRGNTVD